MTLTLALVLSRFALFQFEVDGMSHGVLGLDSTVTSFVYKQAYLTSAIMTMYI